MKHIITAAALAGLVGCVAPIDTHGTNTQIAGQCKLVAYQTDQTTQQGVRHGVVGFAIAQSNENVRRQEIFDACLEAGGRP
jgi:hypothetical protein